MGMRLHVKESVKGMIFITQILRARAFRRVGRLIKTRHDIHIKPKSYELELL